MTGNFILESRPSLHLDHDWENIVPSFSRLNWSLLMRRQSRKNTDAGKRIDPMIIVALIGLIGTIIAALLASPLLERLLSADPANADPQATSSNTT